METFSRRRFIRVAILSVLIVAACGCSRKTVETDAALDNGPVVHTNTIKWTTASEVDNFGFDVYRSDTEDGPFARINKEVIDGGGTIDEPRYYEFVDDTIDPAKTYYYYVESISMSGIRERFTPVGKAPPKIAEE